MQSIRNFDPQTITATPRVPDRPSATWGNSADALMAAGWRILPPIELPHPPEGYRTISSTYSQHPERPDEAIGLHVYDKIPRPLTPHEQAVADLQSHGATLSELGLVLASFSGIEPGMSYDEISDIINAQVTALDGDQLTRAGIAVQRANNLYDRLSRAGITGDRFWLAIQLLNAGGGE